MTIALAILKFVLPFVAGAISLAFHRARITERELIDKQVHNERLRSVLFHLDEVVATVVKELSQTLVEALKLASDGKLTPEARAMLRRQAVAKVRDYMGSHGMAELADLLKLAEGALLGFIEAKIEARVHDIKQSAAPVAPQPSVRLPAPTLS